ncbi:MAG TPA: 3-methyl-2-oxobutanoate hydroxymethyltransferase [Burkholderiales bacterium]|nr:3-methyl-2-oxobutanoate hydroxymethyltransferase [Burkholderiales bacterium]
MLTLDSLNRKRQEGVPIAALTCYDSSFAVLLEDAGVDILLVGDSLGMVIQGRNSTLSVSMEDMVYHTKCVSQSSRSAFIMADMPFGSYQENAEKAFANAARLLSSGAHMVKIEGPLYDTVGFLSQRGIPVCAHIGLTPQSVHRLGGYRVQGKSEEDAKRLLSEAAALEQAGASIVLMEAIPGELAAEITESLSIPTIGIGAGSACSGQVLVLYDMLGIYPGRQAKFVKNYMQGASGVSDAVGRYVDEVRRGVFPGPEHTF